MTLFNDPAVLFNDLGAPFNGERNVILGTTFTPPLVRDRPPYLPDSDASQQGLWRHFENRLRGVNVFKCTNAAGQISYVQDTATPENKFTNIPYPWDPDNPSGPYVYVTNWDGSVTKVSHPVWIITAYYGGHSYDVSEAEAALLAGYTAGGLGYSDCLNSAPILTYAELDALYRTYALLDRAFPTYADIS